MFKFLKIIFFNIFFLLFILLFVDWYLIVKDYYNPYWVEVFPREENNISFDNTKKSVITAGCSFTYGANINTEDTFAYKLQQYTKRKTYNKGMLGYGPQQLLWQVQKDSFYKKEIVEPEYYIYTFISDHMRRMYMHYFSRQIEQSYIMDLYKVKNGQFIPRKEGEILFKDYVNITKLAKTINYTKVKHFKSNDEKFDLFKLYMKEIRKELKKRYPNIKFVILLYNLECDTYHHDLPAFKTDRWKELEDEGFIIVHLDTSEFQYLNTKEYYTFDEVHPSGKAWEKIVPFVAKELNL